MVVLEKPLTVVHEELDVVTTPAGDLVAMVHCNNGASELGTWAGVFAQFSAAIGRTRMRTPSSARCSARPSKATRMAAGCSPTTTLPESRSPA